MSDLSTVIEVAGALSAAGGLGYAKARSPRVFWSLVGAPVARVRFSVTYRATMDVCGLTVQPSRLRAFMVRNVARQEVQHDVLRRVKMPRRLPRNTTAGPLVVPVALREDGTAFVRDYQKVPHALTVGANQSGKSMYQRNLISQLAKLPVGLIGIDCKRGVEQRGYAPRLSALAITPDEADGLLEALIGEMEERFDLLSSHGVPDMWGLPAKLRPVPLVVLVDEVAELFLVAAKKDEERRDRMVMRMIRLAQMARAVGIFLEVCGQRFGSDLGKGATALRAQLTGRVVHRVNDKQTAEMALGDIAPEAVFAATTIPPDRPGVAVAGDSSGGWSRIRTPAMTPGQAVAVCHEFAHVTPHLAALAPFRPAVSAAPDPGSPLLKSRPATG
ncbi:FtsK/SpoIIIE domain-containing protein [Streptomyces californicus]|uniref:FtsK/SpoIIIE domain-containing protein n=1 Tax=Streptomyces californicus TaxID=67351 RepID=UPI0004C1791E|nr:FtsK/SpoIIIE domain-containing protein [Streptomyces californicus]